jgi:ABC-type phosphate/phosphonate transport system substrate-binding protein
MLRIVFLTTIVFITLTSFCLSDTFITGRTTASDVKIAVLSIRGPEDAIKFWKQIADHLNANITDHHFVIVPYSYKEMELAVANGNMEFVVANPAQYIELSEKYGVSRIATQISHVGHIESPYIGSVIFTKANRADIATLSDLRGKSLVTASKTAFASWLVTRDELKHQGILSKDLASVQFTGSSSDKVVMAVKNGDSDAGAVRTGILEQLAQEGKIALSDFRIINQKHVEGFPFLLSSELYPDFAFARLKQTDKQLANRVAAQLLLLSHDTPTKLYPNPIGWSVPDNYDNVRKLLQEWRLPPYEEYGKVSFREAIRQHWITNSLAFLSLYLIVFLSLNIKHRKMKYKILKEAKQELEERNELVKEQRDLLTREKEKLEAALAQVKLLEGIIPICSYCHKIKDDKNSWLQMEQYISEHSEAQFSHGACPHCFEQQLKVIENMEPKSA